MGKKITQVPVARRALVARINRALAKESKQLRQPRGDSPLGQFFVLDLDRNEIDRDNVDLEAYARQLEVLRPWEKLGDPE